MKAKYIFILVVVWLLPTVGKAQAVSIQPNVSNTPSQSLQTTVGGIGSVQMNGTDYHSSGISVTRKSHKRTISLSPIAGTLVASPVQSSPSLGMQAVPMYSAQAWKGELSTMGAEAPSEVRVKHRLATPPPGEPNPDPEEDVPVGDMPWWVLVVAAAGYVVGRRWRMEGCLNTNCTN